MVGSRTRRAERRSSDGGRRSRAENVRSFSGGDQSRQPEHTKDREVQKPRVDMDLPDPSVHIAVQFTKRKQQILRSGGSAAFSTTPLVSTVGQLRFPVGQ